MISLPQEKNAEYCNSDFKKQLMSLQKKDERLKCWYDEYGDVKIEY